MECSKQLRVGIVMKMDMLPNETLEEAQERFEKVTNTAEEEGIVTDAVIHIKESDPVIIERDHWANFITHNDAVNLCKMIAKCVIKSGNYNKQEIENLNTLLEEDFVLSDVLDNLFIETANFIEWYASK